MDHLETMSTSDLVDMRARIGEILARRKQELREQLAALGRCSAKPRKERADKGRPRKGRAKEDLAE